MLRSVLLEMLLSLLLAPIRMLAHSRYIMAALGNVSLRWAGQNRTQETSWRNAIISQAPGTAIALCWSGFALWLDDMFFYWSLPVAIPLLLAAPISVLTGRITLSRRLERWGFLRIPPEITGSALLDELGRMPIKDSGDTYSAFVQAVLDPVLNRVHCTLARGNRRGVRQSHLVPCVGIVCNMDQRP